MTHEEDRAEDDPFGAPPARRWRRVRRRRRAEVDESSAETGERDVDGREAADDLRLLQRLVRGLHESPPDDDG